MCNCYCQEKETHFLAYWGYLHSLGEVKVKRWQVDLERDCDKCYAEKEMLPRPNGFVRAVAGPVLATNLGEAKELLIDLLRAQMGLPKVPAPPRDVSLARFYSLG